MAKKRKTFSENQNIVLVSEVDGVCPKCTRKIMYDKKERLYKGYEIAHIYPLNAKPEEEIELKGVEIPGDGDLNHLDNLIPLCETCHTKFDKPRTKEEYNELLKLKKDLVLGDKRKSLTFEIVLEKEISQIIDTIYDQSEESDKELSLDPLEINKKLHDDFPPPTKRKIENNIRDYFPLVKRKLKEINEDKLNGAKIIATQVKLYYLKLEGLNKDQVFIYEGLIKWFKSHTNSITNDGPEILTAFFIQNCEVFDDCA